MSQIETIDIVERPNSLAVGNEIGTSSNTVTPEWKAYEKVAFRVAFIFFVCLSIPNGVEWYKHVANIDWTNLHYRDLYDIARFGSGIDLFGNTFFGSKLNGYANWIVTFLVAVVGGFIWTWVAAKKNPAPKNYNVLYYWLRVIVRYRAGIGIIGFGFTKLLPVQMPYPSLGLLETNLGDFTAQKIYWLSIGIVPWYQIFAGVVEVGAGTLLFFRRTTTLGAILLFGALGDIVYVNFAYDGGVHVYSSYFVLLAGFLIIHDIPKLYRLLIQERFTVPVNYYPAFAQTWQKFTRIGLKAAVIVLFLGVLFYLQLVNFLYDPYKQPSTAGVKKLRGTYHVSEFRINNQTLPFSPEDSIRWQDVTFEKWTTLTYKVNRPLPLDLSNGGGDPMRDINRTFEISGVGGGRRIFHYLADTVNQVLYLQDKYFPFQARRNRAAGVGGDGGQNNSNTQQKKKEDATAYDEDWIPKEALANIGDENKMIDKRAASTRRDREFAEAPKNEKRNRMILKYSTTDGSRVILTGTDDKKNSVYIVLDKANKQYALSESTLEAGQY